MQAKNLDPKLAAPVHFSALKKIGKCPAHYEHAVLSGFGKQTLQMRLGSGAHALLFGEPYAVYVKEENKAAGKNTVRNGKHWEDFQAAHPGYVITNEKEDAEARAMVAAIRAHKGAARILLRKNADREKMIKWRWLGRECAGTPDLVCNVSLDELKSTRSSEPDKFVNDGKWLKYHAQLAWYRIGARENGIDPGRCSIIAVENTPPYVVTVFPVTERALDKGERLCRLWMERLLICEQHNDWPGYIDDEATFDFDIPDADELDWDAIDAA